MSNLKIIGELPYATGGGIRYKRAVGTVFPKYSALVCVPGVHIHQRLELIKFLNEERQKLNNPPLSESEEDDVLNNGVDLFFRDNDILIRPQPDKMELVFQADELLQSIESKLRIKFLQATDKDVLLAIKKRGECWRINPLPRSQSEIKDWIAASKTAISSGNIYYHNMITGTRFLTYENFANLESLPYEQLVRQLEEIKIYSNKRNQLGHPEIAFFQTNSSFTAGLLQQYDFKNLDEKELLRVFYELREKFKNAVREEMRFEDLDNLLWRNTMYSALISHEEGIVADSILRGLSPEYFMQLEWLPGGRIEEGELIFDSIFDEQEIQNGNAPEELNSICDIRVKNFIFNFIREFGDVEYINIASVPMSLSKRTEFRGHRGVYLAEVKTESSPTPIVRIIRMQKWDVAGHLDNGKPLLEALLQSAEYSEYVLDRRLACRQLGMNLPPRILMHKMSEVYKGTNPAYQHQIIWSTYFERDYQHGIATDKIPLIKYKEAEYAKRFAELLGKAAAPNMIVGRTQSEVIDSMNVLFDDGDEIIVEDENGMPREILIADPTGAFGNFRTPLDNFAEAYAMPVVKRWQWLTDKETFIKSYLTGFIREFNRIKYDYKKRKRAFDALFKHRPWHEGGSLAFRWECVLKRLNETEPVYIASCIEKKIREMINTPRKFNGFHAK